MQFKLVIEYDGTNYAGWQVQNVDDSIQGRLEAALARLFSAPVRLRAAGRTDAGVHARGQVAAFAPPRAIAPDELCRALNALLPADIVVLDVAPAAGDFDPRRHAKLRVYEYRVLNRSSPSAFEYRFSWHVREPLDLDAMNRAARRFIGEHDFAAFRSLGTDVKSTVRRVDASAWRRDGAILTYRVEATAFLRHQVRTMVAAMVDAGRGKIAVDDVGAMLRSRDRARAPAPAPASGLFLVEVRY